MPIMKRVGYVVGVLGLAMVVLGGFGAPLDGLQEQLSLVGRVAACPNNGVPDANGNCGSDFVKTDGCVNVAIPILSGGAKCVSNSQGTGGAIVNYLREILKLLSGAVSLVIMLMLIISGVQYITSTADPARVKAAKTRLQNAIIALLLFLTMFAILTFLVPGGIL